MYESNLLVAEYSQGGTEIVVAKWSKPILQVITLERVVNGPAPFITIFGTSTTVQMLMFSVST